MKISVVIPCYGGQTVLDRTMDTLRAQTMKPHEIIVVDDGSSPKISADGAKIVRVDRIAGYRGSSSAKNIGADMATGDWLCFSDNDIMHASDALESVAARIESMKRDDVMVNVLSVNIDDADLEKPLESTIKKYRKAGRLLDHWYGDTPSGEIFGMVSEDGEGGQRVASSEQHMGVINRDFFTLIGKYDSRTFKSWGLNNQDLSLRVIRAGGVVISDIRRVSDDTLLHCFHQHNPSPQDKQIAQAEFRSKWGRNYDPTMLV